MVILTNKRLPDQPRSTRAERSYNAVNDISSLAPQSSRGIDARSLAAKPPPGQTFTVTRRFVEISQRGRGTGGISSNYRGRGTGGVSPNYRGRGGLISRVGAQAGPSSAGRGAGRGVGRARRRGGGPKVDRKPKAEVQLDDYDPPYTIEEQEYLNSQEGGEWESYNPVTSLSDLESWGPAIATSDSTTGLKESIIYKLQVASGTLGQKDVPTPPERHLANIERGLGTVFESQEEKEAIEKWRDGEEAWRNEIRWKVHKDYKIEGLSKEEREALLKEMVAGIYKKPGDVQQDLYGSTERLARKNETFLPEDSRSLQGKLKSMMPANVE